MDCEATNCQSQVKSSNKSIWCAITCAIRTLSVFMIAVSAVGFVFTPARHRPVHEGVVDAQSDERGSIVVERPETPPVRRGESNGK